MKVIVAIDSFKGCLSSAEAGAAVAAGIKARWGEAEVVWLPVSDGGEGWLEAFTFALKRGEGEGGSPMEKHRAQWPRKWKGNRESYKCQVCECVVSDPLLRPVCARYLKAGELAVVEVAEACGLHLLRPEERNPLRASSRGVGELIADAMKRGCKRFVVGLGGSAVSDAGRGMMEAVSEVASFIIATDVANPLYGPDGAAAVFGPQKGATPAMVAELDRRAKEFADNNARLMGFDRSGEPGAGAAGGLGYAFMQFFGAERRSGAELLLETMDFDGIVRNADFIVTGEGRADCQTLMGKLPSVILRHTKRMNIPCHLIAGAVTDRDALLNAGFASVSCINPPELPLSEAIKPEIALRNLRLCSF